MGKALQPYVHISHTITKFRVSVRNEDFKRFLVELNMFNFISRNFFQLFIDTIMKQYLHQFGRKKFFPKENLPKSVLNNFCVSNSPLCRVN